MHCLLIAATAKEIAPFVEYFGKTKKRLAADLLITSPGSTATAYSLTKQLHLKRPDIVIQAGIAGSFDKQFPPGKTVLVKSERFADLGVIESGQFRTLFDLGLATPNRFPFKNGWLVNPGNVLFKQSKLETVKGISVNQVSTSGQLIKQWVLKYKPVTESLEGAALHYVCLMENIPFLQIRSISNYIGERDKKKWKLKEAITNLNQELINLIEKAEQTHNS